MSLAKAHWVIDKLELLSKPFAASLWRSESESGLALGDIPYRMACMDEFTSAKCAIDGHARPCPPAGTSAFALCWQTFRRLIKGIFTQ